MDSETRPSVSSKSEYIIQHIVRCGRFQVLLVFLVFIVTKLSTTFVMIFMSFGNYNPGWRCLDRNFSTDVGYSHKLNPNTFGTTIHRQQNNTTDKISYVSNLNENHNKTVFFIDDEVNLVSEVGEFVKDHCILFDACENIQFHPGTSTIISEWNLLCGNAWIPSIILSVQMIGLFLGSLFAGYIGDAIGRKKTIYGAQAMVLFFTIISIFSTSWQMFAALRFFLGFGLAGILTFYYVYTVEFVTMKWRAPLPNIPFWPFTCTVFALVCMWLKDWRHIHIASAVLSVVGFLPVFWVPESLRWLEAKDKEDELVKAAEKISKFNGKLLPSIDSIQVKSSTVSGTGDEVKTKPAVTYNIVFLFKNRTYRVFTILLTVPWLLMSMIYYALSFGVKSLHGDFYINQIIMYAIELPFTFISATLPNFAGRKISALTFSGLSGLCLLAAGLMHHLTFGESRTIGVLVLAMVGRVTMGAFWASVLIMTAESYPTAIRGLGTGWGNTMARLGGIAAPFLIPNNDGAFFVCYMIMAGLAAACSLIMLRLPETRGKELVSKVTPA